MWNIEQAVEKTVELTKEYLSGNDINICMERQIKSFMEEFC